MTEKLLKATLNPNKQQHEQQDSVNLDRIFYKDIYFHEFYNMCLHDLRIIAQDNPQKKKKKKKNQGQQRNHYEIK